MYSRNIYPDLLMYNSLLDSWCKQGKRGLKYVSPVLRQMKSVGLAPDEVTFNSIINGWCKAGEMAEATATLDEMRECGLMPNKKTYTSLVQGWGSVGDPDKAEGVFREMCVAGHAPDVVAFSILITAYGKAHRLNDAVRVFESMDNYGDAAVKRNVYCYNPLIATCANSRDANRSVKAHYFFQKMRLEGIRPDASTKKEMLKVIDGGEWAYSRLLSSPPYQMTLPASFWDDGDPSGRNISSSKSTSPKRFSAPSWQQKQPMANHASHGDVEKRPKQPSPLPTPILGLDITAADHTSPAHLADLSTPTTTTLDDAAATQHRLVKHKTIRLPGQEQHDADDCGADAKPLSPTSLLASRVSMWTMSGGDGRRRSDSILHEKWCSSPLGVDAAGFLGTNLGNASIHDEGSPRRRSTPNVRAMPSRQRNDMAGRRISVMSEDSLTSRRSTRLARPILHSRAAPLTPMNPSDPSLVRVVSVTPQI